VRGGVEIARQPEIGESELNAAYLAAIVESSDDAIIGKDLLGTIRSWNRGAQAIFGYSPDEVMGQPIQLIFPPDRVGEEDMIVQRIRAGERVEHFESVRRRKDGSDFPVSVTISPIRDVHGTIVGASKILQDISARHRAQAELAEAKADLERLVIERTNALMQRDLLLSEVYHRVKNNLQMVDALLLMRAVRLTDLESREALMDLRSRVFALGLVHQQLMESPDLKTFDIGPFLVELSANIMGGSSDGRIKLEVDTCPLDVGLDFAVPLGLMVTELLTNSLKHAFPNGRAGQITVALRVDADKRLELTVADNGIGQAINTMQPVKAGTGSSIIRKLVAQLGGEMSVRSDSGTTTEIIMSFPEPL
jgi:PAS domain S-box-containing protein